MDYEILETRNYVGVGLKNRGDILRVPRDCSKEQAEQYVKQGFAKERTKPGDKLMKKEV